MHVALGMEAEDTVAGDFYDAIETMVGLNVGQSGRLAAYEWGPDSDEDDSGPTVVVRDGRQFEVEWDVTVIELTEEELASRASLVAKLKAMKS